MSERAKYIIWFIVGALGMFLILKIASKTGKEDNSEVSARFKELAKTQEVYLLVKTKEFRDLVLTRQFRDFVKVLAEDQLQQLAKTIAG
jgi:hypothetical protein